MSSTDENLRHKASHFSMVTDTSEATLVTSLSTSDPCVNFSHQSSTNSSRTPSISVTVVNSPPSSSPHSSSHNTLRRLTTRMRSAPARHMSKHRPLLHKAHNKMRYGWHDFVRIRGSIIPYVFLPTMVLTLWSIAWLLLNKSAGWTWFLVSNQLVTILGVVMSLLLVFRTNTAYDRYWEGRRTWSTLLTQVRNMARLTWLGVQSNGEHDVFEQKKGCLSLLLAFVVATKHYLRNEEGHNWDDLRHLLQHLPDFCSTIEGPHVENLPVEVSLHLTSYINRVKDDGLIEAGPFLAMTNAVNAMVDCLSSFERIRNSPIPMAYHVHLRQSLWLYLISLPFQTVQTIGWGTVPVVMLASFTMLGIDSIGRQIEDPFGYDENDLPVDDFCEETERELGRLMGMSEGLTPERWGFAREMVRVDPKQDGALVIEVGVVGGKEL